jgi:hypothetical protein
LIKTENEFPVPLLEKWKRDAEEEMRNALTGNGIKSKNTTGVPYLEAELLWVSTGRYNKGYDPKKNFEKFGGNVIYPSDYPIFYWQLKWDFTIVVYNNSQYPAYNIRLKEVGDKHFSYIEPLSKKNNLPPFANLDLVMSKK